MGWDTQRETVVHLGSQGVSGPCHVVHLPELGLFGFQVMLVIELPPVLRLIGRISRKITPPPTSCKLCPGSARYVAFFLRLLSVRRRVVSCRLGL